MALEIVQALIRLADRDIEALLKPIAAESGDMELESVAIRPEGIVIKGRYSMGFMKVGVELVLTPVPRTARFSSPCRRCGCSAAWACPAWRATSSST